MSMYINPDLTQKEREAGKRLRDELAQRRRAGEQNIYIKRGRIISGAAQGAQSMTAAHSGSAQPSHSNEEPSIKNHGKTGSDFTPRETVEMKMSCLLNLHKNINLNKTKLRTVRPDYASQALVKPR